MCGGTTSTNIDTHGHVWHMIWCEPLVLLNALCFGHSDEQCHTSVETWDYGLIEEMSNTYINCNGLSTFLIGRAQLTTPLKLY